MQHPSIATRTRILPGLTAGVVLLTLIGGVVEAIGEDPLKPLELGQVHPGGLACRVQAWKPGYHVARPGDP